MVGCITNYASAEDRFNSHFGYGSCNNPNTTYDVFGGFNPGTVTNYSGTSNNYGNYGGYSSGYSGGYNSGYNSGYNVNSINWNSDEFAGMTTEQKMQKSMDLQLKQLEFQNTYNLKAAELQVNQNKAMAGVNVQANGQNLAIQDQATTIASMITQGKNDQVIPQFNELVEMLRTKPEYLQLDDRELRATAKDYFKQVAGRPIEDMVNEHCAGGFGNAFVNTLSFGLLGSQSSKEDILANLTGTNKTNDDSVAKVAGSTLGGATTGAAIGGVIGGFCGAGVFSWATAPIGAGIGAIVGGIAGLIKGFF